MTSPAPIRPPEERRLLGLSRHPGTGWRRRDGEVWLVLHRGREPWTAVWRLDPRDGRTLHLERALEGDRRAALALWAAETFRLRDAPALAAA